MSAYMWIPTGLYDGLNDSGAVVGKTGWGVAGIISDEHSSIKNVYVYDTDTYRTNSNNYTAMFYNLISLNNVGFENINVYSDKYRAAGVGYYVSSGNASFVTVKNTTINSAYNGSLLSAFAVEIVAVQLTSMSIVNSTFNVTDNVASFSIRTLSNFVRYASIVQDLLIYGVTSNSTSKINTSQSTLVTYANTTGATYRNVVVHANGLLASTTSSRYNILGPMTDNTVVENIFVYMTASNQYRLSNGANIVSFSTANSVSSFTGLDFKNSWALSTSGVTGGVIVEPKMYKVSVLNASVGSDIYYLGFKHSASTSLSGAGTKASPYLISSENDLFAFANMINTGKFDGTGTAINATYNASGKYYKLTKDLDISGYLFTPIGTYHLPATVNIESSNFEFKGTFDGDGHVITGLRVFTYNTRYAGLFGRVASGNITNINLKNVYIVSGNAEYTGGIVGFTSNANLEGLTVDGQVLGRNLVGGIVAYFGLTSDKYIANSGVSGWVHSLGTAGGVVGQIPALTSGSARTANVQYSYNQASVVGRGGLESTSYALGGIVGTTDNNQGSVVQIVISDCYNTGTLYGHGVIGGIMGKLNNTVINNCYSAGTIYVDSLAYWSGTQTLLSSTTNNPLTAGNFSTTSYAWNTAVISKVGEIGGYAMQNNVTIVNSYYVTKLIFAINSSGKTTQIPVGKAGNAGTTPYGISTFTGKVTPAVFYVNGTGGQSALNLTNQFKAYDGWTLDESFNGGYPTLEWAVGEAVTFVNNSKVTTHTLKSTALSQGKSIESSALSATETDVNTTVTVKKYDLIGNTIEIENGKVVLPNNVFYFNGKVYIPKNSTLDFNLVPDENYVIDKSAVRDYYNGSVSRADNDTHLSEKSDADKTAYLSTFTDITGTDGAYQVTVDSSKQVYVAVKNDVFSVTIKAIFATANDKTQINTSGNEYLNIVLYNKSTNMAYADIITANDTAQTVVFEGLNGGDYVIGIYESMFYEIDKDTDVSYVVGSNSSVNIDKTPNLNYKIELDNSKLGIVITVIVTKQYDGWLYNIGKSV